jgi:protein tyrosine phosphatase
MVWQERASCIVMVTRTFDFIRVMCVQYWPAGKDREEIYSGVGVTVENEEQLANFMIRTIKLRKVRSDFISLFRETRFSNFSAVHLFKSQMSIELSIE